jgi:SAM-dependent methyltransferase
MEGYWDARFRREGRIWGVTPSRTAVYAERLFSARGVKSVLVPGSGYGRNAEYLAAHGYAVTGVEVSSEALKLAAERSSEVRYQHGSVLELALPQRGFDAIYCFNVLHLFREKERRAFIARCSQWLKDGGLAFFIVFSEQEPSYGRGAQVETNTFESKPGRPVHYYTATDLAQEFRAFAIFESGLMEDPEDHGDEGPHVHVVRYIFAQVGTRPRLP